MNKISSQNRPLIFSSEILLSYNKRYYRISTGLEYSGVFFLNGSVSNEMTE